MKKISHPLALFNMLVAIFLLASIVCSQFSSYGSEFKSSQVIVSKKTSSSSQSFAQFCCEEKEKEEKNNSGHSDDHFFLCYSIVELLQPVNPDDEPYFPYDAPRSCGDASDIPLYLVKQTFLI